ncbi:hypothetical protein HOLleu_34033 [Holothuria leucospilota]|uniref:C-type lectin domain-containing protein n=1 Tax=Holothuria leucospilota TaxID=206669 RepID=A0A9Q1BH18_HOLLE|nr:hypothetical protein HOLleu_34033 [Holothuria leucospilota]
MVALERGGVLPYMPFTCYTTLSPARDGATMCRKDWTQYGNECFYYNTNSLSVSDAQAYCETQGGNLASIISSGARDTIRNMISTTAHIGKQ